MREHLHLGSTVRRVAFGFVLLIISARVAAPYVIERVVNDKLRDLDGYTGHIDDVDLNLWRGAYEVEGIVIEKTGGKVPVPFLAIERLDLGVSWSALLDGSVVATVALFRPQVNFVKGPTKATSQSGADADWQKTLTELVPLRIDRFVVVDGEVHYRDFHAKPRVDVMIDHLNVKVSNLTNSKELSTTRVAQLTARANVMRSGKLAVDGDIDPFTKKPTFKLKTRLDDLQLRQLNPFLKAYVNIDVNKGRVSVYSDLVSRNGAFKGYVKPLIEDLDVLDWKREDERPIEKMWEALVGGVAEIFQNQNKDRLATKIPLEGQFNKPDVNAWQAILELLRNAFIEALRHGLDIRKG